MNSRILCRLGFHGKWDLGKIVKVYADGDNPQTALPIGQRAIVRCSECGIPKGIKL